MAKRHITQHKKFVTYGTRTNRNSETLGTLIHTVHCS